MVSQFTTDGSKIEVNVGLTDYAKRQELFGLKSYILEATLSNASQTIISRTFTIDYQDPCRGVALGKPAKTINYEHSWLAEKTFL